MKLIEMFNVNETPSSKTDEVVEKIAQLYPEYIGDTDEAISLIMALVDQAGVPVGHQKKVEDILKKTAGRGAGVRSDSSGEE